MPIMLFLILILIFVVLLVVVTNIVIVPQSMVYVVERLGSYSETWSAGLHVKIPFLERVAKKVSHNTLPNALQPAAPDTLAESPHRETTS